MDTAKPSVKPACTFAACGKPATSRIEIDYPAKADRAAFTLTFASLGGHDLGFRCDPCLAFERELAGMNGTTVRSEALVEVPA